MVRFKVAQVVDVDPGLPRFHPTMVRFKAGPGRRGDLRAYPRFHPTMVRFKAGLYRAVLSEQPVSIPLWCDLKGVAT